jgi:hypothetical protein
MRPDVVHWRSRAAGVLWTAACGLKLDRAIGGRIVPEAKRSQDVTCKSCQRVPLEYGGPIPIGDLTLRPPDVIYHMNAAPTQEAAMAKSKKQSKKPAAKKAVTKKAPRVVEHPELKAGDRFVSSPKYGLSCTITADQKIRFNGELYDTLTGAAMAAWDAMKNKGRVSGWVFWKAAPASAPEKVKAPRKPRAKKGDFATTAPAYDAASTGF